MSRPELELLNEEVRRAKARYEHSSMLLRRYMDASNLDNPDIRLLLVQQGDAFAAYNSAVIAYTAAVLADQKRP